MALPLVSIVVPVHDAGDDLRGLLAALHLVRPRREEQYVGVLEGPQSPQHLHAVDPRETDVEHHDVRAVRSRELQRLLAVLAVGHGEPLVPQEANEDAPQLVGVLHDEGTAPGSGHGVRLPAGVRPSAQNPSHRWSYSASIRAPRTRDMAWCSRVGGRSRRSTAA